MKVMVTFMVYFKLHSTFFPIHARFVIPNPREVCPQ